MDRIHSQSPKREVKKKKTHDGDHCQVFRETRGRGGRCGGRATRRVRVREGGRRERENGDGGRQMARDERKTGSERETDKQRVVERGRELRKNEQRDQYRRGKFEGNTQNEMKS